MKKLLIIMMFILMLCLTACGSEKCTGCGEYVKEGYNAFGEFYCEDCFF